MTIEVDTPDGIAEFPDGTANSVIEAALAEHYGASKPAQPERSTDYLDRVGADIGNRANTFNSQREDRNPLSSVLQGAGFAAGAVNDVIGEGLHSAASLLPESIKQPIKSGIAAVAGTDTVQDAARNWQYFSQQHPEAAANISSAANIAMLAPAGKAGEAVAGASKATLGRAGDALVENAAAKQAEAHSAFVKDLVRTPANAANEVGRTSPGTFWKPKDVTPDAWEAKMHQAVKDVPGVSADHSTPMQANYNAISNEVSTVDDHLLKELRKSPSLVDPKNVEDALVAAKQRVPVNAFVGEAGPKMADKLIDDAMRIVKDHPNTPAGLLESRRAFDKFVSTWKKEQGVFDPDIENAASIATREVRQTMNDLVEAHAPDAGTKATLAYQNTLLSALDNIAPKAISEAPSGVDAMAEFINKHLPPGKKISGKTISLAGLGATAAIPLLPLHLTGPALAAAGAVGGVMGAKALVTSAAPRKALGELLRKTDEAIQYLNGSAKVKAAATAPTTAADRMQSFAETQARTKELPTVPAPGGLPPQTIPFERSGNPEVPDFIPAEVKAKDLLGVQDILEKVPVDRGVLTSPIGKLSTTQPPFNNWLPGVGEYGNPNVRPAITGTPGKQIPSAGRPATKAELDAESRIQLEQLHEIRAQLTEALKAQDMDKMGVQEKLGALAKKYPKKGAK